MSHKKFGPIGSAVLTFIGYMQTDKPNLYIYNLFIDESEYYLSVGVFVCARACKRRSTELAKGKFF